MMSVCEGERIRMSHINVYRKAERDKIERENERPRKKIQREIDEKGERREERERHSTP